MSKKDKEKSKKKDKKEKKQKKKDTLLATIKVVENAKSKCCGKYEKGENKRCGRCPMFDLIQKVA
ncbi:hypothetical protein [Flavobacterium sp. TSSA_36]|jgi:hypothetical protein|uniref:hypothetical protein n=1 Tax=Flavobacterium sp. TSSA_36 TaxID=3447669 RepID=UPI003F4059A3